MNFGHFHLSISHTLDCKTTQNMVVGEYGIKTFKVVIVVLFLLLMSFDVFVHTSARPLLVLDKWVAQINLNNILKCVALLWALSTPQKNIDSLIDWILHHLVSNCWMTLTNCFKVR